MQSMKEYAKAHNIKSVRTIENWINKGFFPKAQPDDATGELKIPKSSPVPYHEKGLNNVVKSVTLMTKLLDAGTKFQSVFPSMFSGLAEEVVLSTLDDLVDGGYIEVKTTQSGERFLKTTLEGTRLKTELETMSEKSKVSIEGLLNAGKAVAEIANLILSGLAVLQKLVP